jgi:hypothetical protein
LLIARAVLRTGPLLRTGLVAGPPLLAVLRLAAVGGALLVALLRLTLLAVALVRFLLRLGSRAGIIGRCITLLRFTPFPTSRLGIARGRLPVFAVLAAILTTITLGAIGLRSITALPAAVLILAVPLLATALAGFRVHAALVAVLTVARLVARLPVRRALRLRRRRGAGVDAQRLPFRPRLVRHLRAVVHRDGPVFDNGPRAAAELPQVEPADAAPRALLVAAEDHRFRDGRPTLQPRLDADACQSEVGIDRPHADRHHRAGRHP